MSTFVFPLLAQTEEWDGDEIMLLLGCGVATAWALWWLWSCLATVPSLGSRPAVRGPILGAVGLSAALLVFVTWRWTAVEIRGGEDYMWLAFAMGGAWFGFYVRMFRWLGIGLREDACERTNPAAVAALCGAIPGGALLYCGAICGEGPSFWNNVFTVLVAGAVWFFLWFLLDLATSRAQAIAEERDVTAGWRLGGFLLATGLLVGRAAAGNWHSMEATFFELLRDSWRGLVLMLAATGVEFFLGAFTPRLAQPRPAWGWIIALGYVLAGAAWVWAQGPWEGMP